MLIANASELLPIMASDKGCVEFQTRRLSDCAVNCKQTLQGARF